MHQRRISAYLLTKLTKNDKNSWKELFSSFSKRPTEKSVCCHRNQKVKDNRLRPPINPAQNLDFPWKYFQNIRSQIEKKVKKNSIFEIYHRKNLWRKIDTGTENYYLMNGIPWLKLDQLLRGWRPLWQDKRLPVDKYLRITKKRSIFKILLHESSTKKHSE